MKILCLGHSFFLNKLPIEKKIFNVGFYDFHKVKLKKAVYNINYILSLAPWKPDIIFLGDDSFPITYIGLEKLDIPIIWYAVDSHIHQWHLFYANIFDITLFAQKTFIEIEFNFPYSNIKKWFPLYCNPDIQKKLNLPKKYDLCFVGTLNPELNKPRVELIENLKKRIKNFYAGTGEFVKIFNESRIVLNQLAYNDINFRTFEALACGSLLLTERIKGNGFNELFNENEHLICYERNNIDEIVEKVNYYIKNEDEANKIAENGYNYVLKKHTDYKRAEQFLNLINSINFEETVNKRLQNMKEINFYLKMAYIAAADAYSYYRELSDFYINLANKISA